MELPLQYLLDRAARLQRRIKFRNETTATLSKRLATLKAEIALLVPAAPESAAHATETKGGGTSWTFPAATGSTVRVTQPAAKLLGNISGELVERLKKLCAAKFPKLFIPHYTCEKNFRELAWQLLEKETAPAVIALVTEPSKPTVTIG